MNAPFPSQLPQCPCCEYPVFSWHPDSWIDACRRCKRPMVVIRWPRTVRGTAHLHGLLDVAAAGYGIGTIILVLAFVTSDMGPIQFVKCMSLLLFVIGSVLVVDGHLSIRTEIDRTWRRRRFGRVAIVVGCAKTLAGTLALILVIMGLLMTFTGFS